MSLKLVFNPFTGNFDFVNKNNNIGPQESFNPDTILTADYNIAGSYINTYDSASGQHVPMGFNVLIDEDGNVMVNA